MKSLDYWKRTSLKKICLCLWWDGPLISPLTCPLIIKNCSTFLASPAPNKKKKKKKIRLVLVGWSPHLTACQLIIKKCSTFLASPAPKKKKKYQKSSKEFLISSSSTFSAHHHLFKGESRELTLLNLFIKYLVQVELVLDPGSFLFVVFIFTSNYPAHRGENLFFKVRGGKKKI